MPLFSSMHKSLLMVGVGAGAGDQRDYIFVIRKRKREIYTGFSAWRTWCAVGWDARFKRMCWVYAMCAVWLGGAPRANLVAWSIFANIRAIVSIRCQRRPQDGEDSVLVLPNQIADQRSPPPTSSPRGSF